MSVESVFNLIKKETNEVFREGKQFKLTTEQIKEKLQINIQTVYSNLTGAKKYKEIKSQRIKVKQLGTTYTYYRKLWWYEGPKDNESI